MVKKIFGFGLVWIVLIGVLVWSLFGRKIDILSPKSDRKDLINNHKNMKVIGFLPTWMVGKTIEYTDEISHLIFLGVEIDEKGNLIWDTQSKKIENETYLKQKRLIKKYGGKNILGIKLFDDDKIDEFLKSNEARINLINQLKDLKQNNGFDGINVDFEYMGNPIAILSEEMIGFLDELKEENLGEISLDVFANTIIKGSGENLNRLIEKTDYLIIMAYDFHRPGVDSAGSVAPIGSVVGDRNIMEVVEKTMLSKLNKEKIIMAYPLYGYEWKTYNHDFESPVKKGWSQMASWKRMKELIKENNLEVKWDELSMTPWVVFEEDNEIHQIYFENEKSLGIKLDLVRNNQFSGVGFWALGYEGEDINVWKLK